MKNSEFTQHLINIIYHAVIISSVVYAPTWVSSLVVVATILIHSITVLGLLAVQGKDRLDLYNKIRLPKILTMAYFVTSIGIGFLISWKLGTMYAVLYLLTYLVFTGFSKSFMESVKKDIDNAKCLTCGVKIEYDPDVCECSECEKISTYLRTRNLAVLDN